MARSSSRTIKSSSSSRRRWRAVEAADVLNRLEVSGLSVRAFAAREGLQLQRLYRWRRVLAGRSAARPAFVELVPASTARLELVLDSGVVLRVPEGFHAETVKRLLEVVEGLRSPC